jgi:isoleucyl-tRNA synthetase
VDVVRLWVASQDFRNDIVVSDERINKVGETYRVIRNALRYQLSNLYDFHPAKDSLPDQKLTGLDRWILAVFSKLEAEVAAAYSSHEFHVVYQTVSQFAAVELSAIYHDVVKDRLYTDAAHSTRRRSTQTALHRMVSRLCAMLSPILTFTADEAWEFLPDKSVDSVHLSDWAPLSFSRSKHEEEAWAALFKMRETALAELEKARQSKLIGKALEAKIVLSPGANDAAICQEHRESLRELLNVSQLDLAEPLAADAPKVLVTKADGQKCERCWHWETDVGTHVSHPTICGRCAEAIASKRAS